MPLPLHIVDVFAERPLAGNQLAVIRGAAGLSDAQMQDIAREMNFSETTFVLEEGQGRATVRIFTPEWELPFAGHPTLGTAWVLSGGEGEYVLDLPVGEVPVNFDDQGIGWIVPPDVKFGGGFARGADLLGLDEEVLHPDYPARLAEVGPRFVLIGVSTLDALRAVRLNAELRASLLDEGVGVQCVFAFTDEAYEPRADFASRMFFESGGLREDAATGSANTAFAAYLRDLHGGDREYVVDQGVEMNRPSRLYLNTGKPLLVGGRVFPSVEGQLNV